MSKIFTTDEEHFRYLNELLDRNPKSAMITTYGIYAGITKDGTDTATMGEKYKSNVRDFLERLKSVETRILVSISGYNSCKGVRYCQDCEFKYINQLMRIVWHKDAFPQFKWKIVTESHAKVILMMYDKEILGVAGGRNLSGSTWGDYTFPIDNNNSRSILSHLITGDQSLWNRARNLNDNTVSSILEEQGVREETFHKYLQTTC